MVFMQHTASLSFRGNADKAFGLAEAALTALGFRLTARTAKSLEMHGPGMNSSRQSELVGASRIMFFEGQRELTLEADLGGVTRMARFVTLFPLGLCLFLAVVLGTVFAALHGPGLWLFGLAAATGSNALMWLWLGPWMARRIRARTCRGLDTLLANMVSVGASA